MDALLQRLGEWVIAHLPNVIRACLVLVAAWVVIKALHKVIRRLERLADDGDDSSVSEREKRAQTLGRILRQVVAVFVWGIAAMSVLSELGVSIGPVLAGAGIAGVAVGFGAQTLVKDVISGFFVLLENQFRVNDVIETAGVSGVVESMNLRTTVLRDVQGRVHIVPNGSIAVVTNYTREWSRAVLDVGVAYKEDTDRVLAILREVGSSMEADPVFGKRLRGPFEYPGIEQFGESAVILRVTVRTAPQERWSVVREMRARVKKAFDEHGIEIPFPHRTIVLEGAAGGPRPPSVPSES